MAQREFLGGQSMRKRLSAVLATAALTVGQALTQDRKSTRLNSSHDQISYAVFCLKKKTRPPPTTSSPPTTRIVKTATLRISPAWLPSSTLPLRSDLCSISPLSSTLHSSTLPPSPT